MSATRTDEYLRLAGEVLKQDVAELPWQEISPFVASYIDRKDAFLQTAEQHGSPLYLIDVDALRERASLFQDAFQNISPRPPGIYYAVKSNHHPLILRTFLEAGLGLDVSSGAELQLAIELEAPDIVFSGPGKTVDELALAVYHANRVTVLIDSFTELRRLEDCAGRAYTDIRAGVRLTSDPSGLWRKFGIAPSELGNFLSLSEQCPHVHLCGLHFHTSWNMDPAKQVSFIQELGATLEALPPRFRKQFEFVDIGGGYWPEQGEWLQGAATPAGMLRGILAPDSEPWDTPRRVRGTPIETFADELEREIREHLMPHLDARICLEPGRWLCNDGMHLLMTVIDCKAPDLVITDAGTNAVGWERFEHDYFPVINLTRPALTEHSCNVLGCLCTPHDVWGYSYWGNDIQEGDILMIPTQGAYTYSLRQSFIKDLPKAVALHPSGTNPSSLRTLAPLRKEPS